ncbi:hypothetical protein IQ06DRAFT_348697 [Phaeosphaeriaceae sp. SRC1lsM3a]|nr:hypothetical protein IQ06DRAFT_348697 [Stagonospora sp. SRC1lsM3a]
MHNPQGSSLPFGATLAWIIARWGFDFSNRGTVALGDKYVFQDDGNDDLKLVKKHDIGYPKDATGYDWLVCTHHGLHDGLLQIALAPGRENPTITIHKATKVTDTDCNAGEITLGSGETAHFELIVIAVGVGSRLIDVVTESTTPPMIEERTAYRFRVPASAVRSETTLAPILARPSVGMTKFVAPTRRIFLPAVEADTR